MIYWGRYWRWAVLSDEHRQRIPVVRKRCVACRHTCSFLPPFLMRRRPWVMDSLVGAIGELATVRSGLLMACEGAAWMSPRAFAAVVRHAAGWAARAGSEVRAWIGSVEPAFDPEALTPGERVPAGRWAVLGRLLVMVEAVGEWRRQIGRGPISGMGLVQFCARHSWAELVAASG